MDVQDTPTNLPTNSLLPQYISAPIELTSKASVGLERTVSDFSHGSTTAMFNES